MQYSDFHNNFGGPYFFFQQSSVTLWLSQCFWGPWFLFSANRCNILTFAIFFGSLVSFPANQCNIVTFPILWSPVALLVDRGGISNQPPAALVTTSHLRSHRPHRPRFRCTFFFNLIVTSTTQELFSLLLFILIIVMRIILVLVCTQEDKVLLPSEVQGLTSKPCLPVFNFSFERI